MLLYALFCEVSKRMYSAFESFGAVFKYRQATYVKRFCDHSRIGLANFKGWVIHPGKDYHNVYFTALGL